MLTHVLHLPTGAVDNMAFYELPRLNVPKITSLRATMYASAYRTAARTCQTWPYWGVTIREAALGNEGLASLHNLGEGRRHPLMWEAPPFFLHVVVVISAQSGDPLADIGLERCTDELSHSLKPRSEIEVITRKKQL